MALDELPADLPVPVDDGGADHLVGLGIPTLTLPAAGGGLAINLQGSYKITSRTPTNTLRPLRTDD